MTALRAAQTEPPAPAGAPSRRRIVGVLSVVLLLTFCGRGAQAAEYFVNKQGRDTNRGLSPRTAFLTIQRGVEALKPGDTLAIGPGEYAETVRVVNLGKAEQSTLIRAEIPGTVLLRGDRDVELDFRKVAGRRFVYAADCKDDVLSVHEVDTLTALAPAADATALEFGPGRFYHDKGGGTLYVSSSDFRPPSRHCYSMGVLRGDGFQARDSRRIVFEGLAARGFTTPVTKPELCYPISGFMLRDCEGCVVRGCVALLNESGVTVNNGDGHGNNRVEGCRTYANGEGIVGYNPSGETFQDCHCFLNRNYGARFYGTRRGDKPCLFSRLVAWGNPGGDYWFKGKGLSEEGTHARAERCVALKDCHIRALSHCVKGSRDWRGRPHPSNVTLPDGRERVLAFLDGEFADPLNFDFRPQATSALRQAGKDSPYRGPYPYTADIRYVSADGNDGSDGLSITHAWKTLRHAFKTLRPGETLYIAGGRYTCTKPLTLQNVRIRGRGMDTVAIDGPVTGTACEDVSFERLRLTGPVRVVGGKHVRFDHCILSGGESVRMERVHGLAVTHGLLTVPLELQQCSKADLRGNLYAASPALRTDTPKAVEYSSYNSYPRAAQCWEVSGSAMGLSDLHKRQRDLYSIVRVPEQTESDRLATLQNAWVFGGRGPLGTAVGPHREWRPLTLRLVGPFVHSVTDTTANVEWWTSLPAEVELRWGNTPECTNKSQVTQTSFCTHSMIGLKPGTTYYVRVGPHRLFSGADAAHRYRLPDREPAVVRFTTAPRPAAPATRYVSTHGSDENDGSTLRTAWRTLQHAADSVRPGDTVLIGGGAYPGTVYFRVTGSTDKPITFKAIPGEKVTIDGLAERLTAGFVLYGKSGYRFDSLYFDGFAGIPDNTAGAECGALLVRGGRDLQVTRCHFSGGWGPGLVARNCPGILVRNCVFMHSMSSTSFAACPDLRVENNAFVSPLIHHILVHAHAGESYTVRNNLFAENTRGKAHIPFASIGRSESNNCFYTRWAPQDRKVMGSYPGSLTLPEYRAAVRKTDSFAANPQWPGARGFCQGWGPKPATRDFPGLFATNPLVVSRGIGLQPEAFGDFHFWKDAWPYDKAWAGKVLAQLRAAEDLVQAGKNAEALGVYARLAEQTPMEDRLRSDVLDRAALCADRLQDYDKATELARRIPLKPLSARRQMALMTKRGRFAELLEAFADRPGHGRPHLSWYCPETEMPLADALYYRATAYAETGDLDAAERELRIMVDKGKKLGYSPGATVLDLCWKRLGDFYHDRRKDDAKALAAYRHVIDRTTVFRHDSPMPKSVLSGTSKVLAAATEATCRILHQQGRDSEAGKLRRSLAQAQADARAFLENPPRPPR